MSHLQRTSLFKKFGPSVLSRDQLKSNSITMEVGQEKWDPTLSESVGHLKDIQIIRLAHEKFSKAWLSNNA